MQTAASLGHGRLDTVLLKVASRCNLNCDYCYIYNMGDDGWREQPTFMSSRVLEALCGRLRELAASQAAPFATVLHGGEPLLLGADRLGRLLSALRAALPPEAPISIQTNGVLISEPILDICALHETSLSVSVDGPREVHDSHRVDHVGGGSFDRVMAGIEALRRHSQGSRLFAGVLAVIDPASSPDGTYSFLRALEAPSIDLLYRDGNRSRLPCGKRSLESTEFGEWVCRFFDRYVGDPKPTPIRFLDDIVRLILGGDGRKEGVGITDYGIVIVEADGSVRANDTLRSAYPGADRLSSTKFSVLSHALQDVMNTEDFRTYHLLQRPTSRDCLQCQDLRVCGGGMPVHRYSTDRQFDNPSVYCADQKLVIRHVRTRISEMVHRAACA